MATGDGEVAARLRGQVLAAGPRYRGARLAPPLRAELIAYACAQRATGVSMQAIAAALGVAPESVRRWTQRSAGAARGALVPVHVVPEPPRASRTALTLVSPRGFRVEGLDLADVGTLLAALG
jgi:transposase-like protein